MQFGRSRQGRRRKIMGTLAAAVAATALAAPAASAGEYVVHSCRFDDGRAAGTTGWSNSGAGDWRNARNDCAAGGAGGLEANLDEQKPHTGGDEARWTFRAPADTKIVRWDMRRAAKAGPYTDNAVPVVRITGGTDEINCTRPQLGCSTQGDYSVWNASGNFIAFPSIDTEFVTFAARCEAAPGYICAATAPERKADVKVFQSRVTLRDLYDPVLTAEPTGTLVEDEVLQGAETLAVSATDRGAGVKSVVFLVDGQPIQSPTADSNGGKCVEPFDEPIPCKLTVNATVTIDTTTIAEGSHVISAKLRDAAGNSGGTVFERTLTVDNVPPPSVSSPPSILGAPKVGNTLVATAGEWTGNGNTYAYQWQRCTPEGDECADVEGATGSEFLLGDADLGYSMRVVVSATNSEGSTDAASAVKGPVTRADGATPQCADFTDNDGDGSIDVADAGCVDRNDDSEHTNNPACANGIDDDADGKVDLLDDGCATSDDNSEVKDDVDGGDGGDGGAGASGTSGSSTSSTSMTTVFLGTPNNGTNASNNAKITLTGSRKRTVKFGRRIATVAHLRDENGRPITGAQVTVMERMNVPGAAWVPAREPIVTDDQGRLRWIIPAKFSRTIRYAYKANLKNTEFQSTSDVVLTVFSKSTLRPSKRSARNGQRVVFGGRLLSKPIPRGGVLIDLQAKVGKRWQTFRTARTKRTGRWRIAYRFRSTRGVQRYSFRARVRQDTGYPYAISRTRAVKVTVVG